MNQRRLKYLFSTRFSSDAFCNECLAVLSFTITDIRDLFVFFPVHPRCVDKSSQNAVLLPEPAIVLARTKNSRPLGVIERRASIIHCCYSLYACLETLFEIERMRTINLGPRFSSSSRAWSVRSPLTELGALETRLVTPSDSSMRSNTNKTRTGNRLYQLCLQFLANGR